MEVQVEIPAIIHELIDRAYWQSCKSTNDYAPHQYVVKGWQKDDLTEEEFWEFARIVKALGRIEEWTPPAEWVGGRVMTNRYLYVGEFAYWFTWPRKSVPMLNREHVSVQQESPTRRVVGLLAAEARELDPQGSDE